MEKEKATELLNLAEISKMINLIGETEGILGIDLKDIQIGEKKYRCIIKKSGKESSPTDKIEFAISCSDGRLLEINVDYFCVMTSDEDGGYGSKPYTAHKVYLDIFYKITEKSSLRLHLYYRWEYPNIGYSRVTPFLEDDKYDVLRSYFNVDRLSNKLNLTYMCRNGEFPFNWGLEPESSFRYGMPYKGINSKNGDILFIDDCTISIEELEMLQSFNVNVETAKINGLISEDFINNLHPLIREEIKKSYETLKDKLKDIESSKEETLKEYNTRIYDLENVTTFSDKLVETSFTKEELVYLQQILNEHIQNMPREIIEEPALERVRAILKSYDPEIISNHLELLKIRLMPHEIDCLKRELIRSKERHK